MGTNKFVGIEKRKYIEVRKDIKEGDLFFASGNHKISKMIQRSSNSMFSHVGIISRWKDRVILLESVEDDGIRAVPLSSYIQNYENTGKSYDGGMFIGRYRKEFSNEELSLLIGTGLDLLNKKYDVAEVIDILARITLSIGTHDSNDSYICSEFVEACFKKIDINFSAIDGGYIFPENIASDENVEPIWELA